MRDDLVLVVHDAGGAVGGVALGADALVPVVIGSGGVLRLDRFEPGILARRLVKMPMNADEASWSVAMRTAPSCWLLASS